MDLSIIIVNYNTKDLTLACIDSILRSNPRVGYEIILIDNGSTDGSAEYFDKIRGSKIRLILHKKNLGFSKANNSGIQKALGRFILLLNSDTEVTRGSIDALYDFALHTPGVGLVGPKLLNLDKSTQASVFRLPTLKRAIKQYWFGHKGIFDKYVPESQKPIEVEAIVAAVMLITPIARRKAGMLDERYFMYFEDLEFCRRVTKAGLKIYYLPSVEIYHHHGASSKNVESKDQWRRLIPSSKIYHGWIGHSLITFVIWISQKLRKVKLS